MNVYIPSTSVNLGDVYCRQHPLKWCEGEHCVSPAVSGCFKRPLPCKGNRSARRDTIVNKPLHLCAQAKSFSALAVGPCRLDRFSREGLWAESVPMLLSHWTGAPISCCSWPVALARGRCNSPNCGPGCTAKWCYHDSITIIESDKVTKAIRNDETIIQPA